MEAGIVLGLGYWGYHAGHSPFSKFALAVLAPVAGFGFWGLVDFHRFGKISEILRLIQELVITGLVVVLLYITGAHTTAWILGVLSVVYHALVYIAGDTLLKKVL